MLFINFKALVAMINLLFFHYYSSTLQINISEILKMAIILQRNFSSKIWQKSFLGRHVRNGLPKFQSGRLKSVATIKKIYTNRYNILNFCHQDIHKLTQTWNMKDLMSLIITLSITFILSWFMMIYCPIRGIF